MSSRSDGLPRRALLAAALLGLILAASRNARQARAEVLSRCPRPGDRYGPRYEEMTGIYQTRGLSRGGGKFLVITPASGAGPVAVTVTDAVFDAAGSLAASTPITLVGYVATSTSGAQPPYGCIELKRGP